MLLRLAIASLGLCLASTLLQAQAVENAPIMGSQSTEELVAQPVDDTYRILVIGDALGGGLGAGLSRMAEPEPRFEIVNRFQETSGLARPEVYDWPASLPKIMEGKDFNAVVVLLGAYDRQAIREGDFRLVFNTPEWKAAYEARIDELLDVLNAAGLKVFWVAIPPMGDALYERDMQVLAALQKQEATAKGATYVDLRANFLGPDGAYTDTGPDDTGEIRKLRTRDGVAFMRQGNSRFGQLLLAEIKRDMETKPLQAALQPAPAAPAVAAETVPLFGQLTIGGAPATFEPDKIKIAKALRSQAMVASNGKITRTDIVPGSSAERLFLAGEAPPAPAGRRARAPPRCAGSHRRARPDRSPAPPGPCQCRPRPGHSHRPCRWWPVHGGW